MINTKTMQGFYQSIEKINLTNQQMEKHYCLLKNIIKNFNERIQSVEINKTLLSKNREVAGLTLQALKDIKQSSEKWSERFNELLKKEQFRNELKDHFIVIIFGKVKAGKSSLGNFIAQNRLPGQEVEFFKYDEVGREKVIHNLEEIGINEFETANTECTVEIQGFKLNGMAWIDTPGLGSMTVENGELAKSYIDSADFIIYPTSSDAPLQGDEKKQLKELFDNNKKVSVYITKSDCIGDEDECDCNSESGCEKCDHGIITTRLNKDPERRKQQEEWVSKEIFELLNKKKKDQILGDIHSLSVLTARAGLKSNDVELFEHSNLPSFYAQMNDVVKNKAKKMKEKVPYERLLTFIDNKVLGVSFTQNQQATLVNLTGELKNVEKKIEKNIKQLEKLKKNLHNTMIVHIDNVIGQLAMDLNEANYQEVFARIDIELEKSINNMIGENVSHLIDGFEVSLNRLVSELESKDCFAVSKKYETVSKRYDDSSLLRKIVHTLTLGIVEKKYKTMTKQFAVGTNKNQMVIKFKKNRLMVYKKAISENYAEIQKEYFVPLQVMIEHLYAEFSMFENEVRQFKKGLKVHDIH